MHVKNCITDTTTPAGCKGTNNFLNRQAISKIIASIAGKFKENGIRLVDFSESESQVIFYGEIVSNEAICPCCGMKSHSVHDYRMRKIRCVEFLSKPAIIILSVRHFYCKNPECKRKTFSEPLKLASRYSRMSSEVSSRVLYESLNQSGRLANESLSRQHITVSKSTCIRRARGMGVENPDVKTSGYIAIDDFAYLKGYTYMCGIMDLYTRKPLAVFGSRYGEDIVEWLRAHREIRLVSRDGSQRYASLITLGAPQARQCTDRFHLLKNLKDTMVEAIRNMLCMKNYRQPYPYPSEDEAYRLIIDDMRTMGIKRHRLRVDRYFTVKRLREQGMTVIQIAAEMGIKSQKVYAAMHERLDKVLDDKQKKIMSHARELAQVVSRGCLTPEVMDKRMNGKLGSYLTHRATRTIREKYAEIRARVRENNNKLKKQKVRVSKKAIWSYIMEGKTECDKLKNLSRTHPYAEQAIKACVDLGKIINGREGEERLEKWVAENKKTECRELAAFAYYLELDMKAVKVACSEYYNNGPMEGTVNKIKAIKRSMFNRAGEQLLRAKIIYANYSKSP